MQQSSNPLHGVGFVYPKIIYTPRQSKDCGACAPKAHASTGFAAWSHTISADPKNTTPLIQKEVW